MGVEELLSGLSKCLFKWWNITSASRPDQHQWIHRSGSPVIEIFPGR